MRPAIVLLLFWPALVLAFGFPAAARHRSHAPASSARHAHLRGAIDADAPSARARLRRGRSEAVASHGRGHGGRGEESSGRRRRGAASERSRHARGGRAAAAQARAEPVVAAVRRAAAEPPAVPVPVPVALPTPGRPREIILQDGESLADVSARYGVTVAALAELNGLRAPYDAPTGQRLKLPPSPAPAPQRLVAAPAYPTSDAGPLLPPALTGTPEAGPRPYRELVPGAAAAPSTGTTPRRSGRTAADALAAYAVASTRAPSLAGREDAVHTRFVWPVRAAVVSGFGAKGTGRRNDGLDLASRPGDAVRAAAAGEVVYAGKEIGSAGGNLVLLKHADGWVTAYSHLGRVTVAMRQTVGQGQEIAEAASGADGAGGAGLHFEVRAPSPGGAKPVDPASVLPPA